MSLIRKLDELNPQLFINTENFWGFFEWNKYENITSPQEKILWVSSDWTKFLCRNRETIDMDSNNYQYNFVVIDINWTPLLNKVNHWKITPIMHNDTILFQIDDDTIEIYDLKNWTTNLLKTRLEGEDSIPNAIWIEWKDKWLIVLIRIKANSNPAEYVKRVYWLDGQLIYEKSLPDWPTEEREKTTLYLNSTSIAIKDFKWEQWVTIKNFPNPSIGYIYTKLFRIPQNILDLFPNKAICTNIGTHTWNKTNWDLFEIIFFDWKTGPGDHTVHSSVIFDKKWTPLFMNKSGENTLVTLIEWWIIEERRESISVLTNKNIWVYDNIEYKKWWIVNINGTSYISKYPLSQHLYSWEEMKLTNCLQEVLELKETNEIVIKWKRYKKSIVLK